VVLQIGTVKCKVLREPLSGDLKGSTTSREAGHARMTRTAKSRDGGKCHRSQLSVTLNEGPGEVNLMNCHSDYRALNTEDVSNQISLAQISFFPIGRW
jgi:hypothetical protein